LGGKEVSEGSIGAKGHLCVRHNPRKKPGTKTRVGRIKMRKKKSKTPGGAEAKNILW